MAPARWLITGASGQLGSHVVRQLAAAKAGRILALAGQYDVGTPGVEVQRIDLADGARLRAIVTTFCPTHIVHLGALTAIGDCYARPAEAERINVGATRVLSQAAADAGARLIFASTDMVFAGDAAPYAETDPPRPLSFYGRTKVAAEQCLAACARTLVVRLPLLYGVPYATRPTTFVAQMAALRSGQPLRLFTDEFRTPVWLADAARAVIGLAKDELVGLVHVPGPQRLSRFELIARCADLLGMAEPNLVPVSRLETATAEPRPADLSLTGARLAADFPSLMPGPVCATALPSG